MSPKRHGIAIACALAASSCTLLVAIDDDVSSGSAEISDSGTREEHEAPDADAEPPNETLPPNALELLLEADDASLTVVNGRVSVWRDTSPGAHSALQALEYARPELVDLGGFRALRFDGVDDHMTLSVPINGLTGATFAVVSVSAVDHAPGASGIRHALLFWNESASWGNTYLSPFQTSVHFRFGTAQVDNLPSFVRPSPSTSRSITIAIHDGTRDSLYVDGSLVLEQSGKLVTIAQTKDPLWIGRGYMDTYFAGDVLAVVVYTRALGDEDRGALERYLRARHGL